MDDPASRVLFGYSSTAVEGYKRCSGYGGCSVFTSSTTGQYLNNRCGSKHLIANTHAGLIEYKEYMYCLLPMTAGFFLSRFLVLVIRLSYFVKTGKCNYSSKLHKFKLLVLLWCWVLGHTLVWCTTASCTSFNCRKHTWFFILRSICILAPGTAVPSPRIQCAPAIVSKKWWADFICWNCWNCYWRTLQTGWRHTLYHVRMYVRQRCKLER